MSLSEINAKLTTKPYVDGYTPSKADADLFNELFGNNQNVIQWAARMAAYFESERQSLSGGAAKAKPAKGEKPAGEKPAGEKPAAKAPEKAASPKASASPKGADKKKEAAPADDDCDLFGEVTEEEKAALDKKKADEEAAKKAKAAKPAIIAKSNIVIDIKPFEDTTDLEGVMTKLRAIERDGLLWGAHRLTEIAYGIKKLTVMIVIEDEKISGDDLEDMVMQFEDEVQSMDIQSWVKV